VKIGENQSKEIITMRCDIIEKPSKVFSRQNLEIFIECGGRDTLYINGIDFELTLHRRDKNGVHVPVWIHNVSGGNYIINASPYLNGIPLSLSIEYIDDPVNGDERDISCREHDIGNTFSEEPIKTYAEYKAQVKLLSEQILNDYTKMIEKQIKELKRD
jgi:hypothetical protein